MLAPSGELAVDDVGQLADDSDSGEVTAELIKRYFAGRAEVTSFAVADAVLAGRLHGWGRRGE